MKGEGLQAGESAQTATPAHRVPFVLEHYHPHVGGVETLFQQLAERLASEGRQVTVLTLRLPATTARQSLGGVEIVRVWTPPLARRYWFTLLAIPAAVRYAGQAGIVHTTTYNAAVPAWVAAIVRRKKRVITVHEVFAE